MICKGQFPDQQELIDENYRLHLEFDNYWVYKNETTGILINKKTNQVELRYTINN